MSFGKRKDGKFYKKTGSSGTKKKGSTSAGGKRIAKELAKAKRQQKERERQEKITEREIDSFNFNMSNYGSSDVATAIEKGHELNFMPEDCIEPDFLVPDEPVFL